MAVDYSSLQIDQKPEEIEEERQGLFPSPALERKAAIFTKKAIPQQAKAMRTRQMFYDRLKPNDEESISGIDLPGLTIPSTEPTTIQNVTNFLFGPDMAIMGMKWDTEGFRWDIDIAKQQWSEEPLWLNLLSTVGLLGTIAFPAARAGVASLRFGSLGAKLGRFGSRADELAKFKAYGAIPDHVTDLNNKTLKKLRLLEHSRVKYVDLAERISKAKGGRGPKFLKNPIEATKLEFDRRFANSYFKLIREITDEAQIKTEYTDALNKLWAIENIGKLFVDIPDATKGAGIYAYMLSKLNPNLGVRPVTRLDDVTKRWADNLYDMKKRHQQEALEEGLIDQATYERIGEIHLPAFMKGTQTPDVGATRTHLIPLTNRKPVTKISGIRAEEVEVTGLFGRKKKVQQYITETENEYIALKTYDFPRLDAPQLYHRQADLPEVARRFLNGDLITDPADLTIRGYVTDRLLMTNFQFIRDLARNPQYAISHAEALTKYPTIAAAQEAGYVSLDALQGAAPNVLRRMFKTKTFELGPNNELPLIQREVFDELFGSSGLFAQTETAGNVLDAMITFHKIMKTGLSVPTHFQNLIGNFVMLSQAGMNPLSKESIGLMHVTSRAFSKWAEIYKTAKKAGINPRELFDKESGLLKGVNLGKAKIGNKVFDLNDEFFDPMVRELIEESAFEQAEGLGHLNRMLDTLGKDKKITRGFIKGLLGVKNSTKMGAKAFDTMTKYYLGEDMVPKMAYFLKLRSEGLSREWAALEVGRRLPMYGTVGSAIRSGRRHIFPWLTFPTEALRITKNNIMDYPIRMMPWLRMPQLLQSAMYMVKGSEGYEQVEEAKEQLPMWAQTPETIVTSGQGARLGAAGSLGFAGAAAGGLARGPAGAAVGAVAGAAAGYALPAVLQDDTTLSNQMRGAILNWLPHSAFTITSTAKGMGEGALPFKDIPTLLQQMPAEPLAIIRPIVEISEGRTAFGSPIGAESVSQQLAKAFAGYLGFLAPPLIQKYGLKMTTPDVAATQLLPGVENRAFFDPTNVSRLLIESGMAIDPNTGKPGSLTFDMIINNLGVFKSYPTFAETQLSNEANTEAHLGRIRGYLGRNLKFHIANGNDAESSQILAKIYQTFVRQYISDPRVAQKKFSEWMEERMQDIGKHPRLRQFSEEELVGRFRDASKMAADVRGQARQQLIQALKAELSIRRSRRQRESKRARRSVLFGK